MSSDATAPADADSRMPDPAVPLDVIGAQTQGMIGYRLAQELRSAGIGPVVTLLTQTVRPGR